MSEALDLKNEIVYWIVSTTMRVSSGYQMPLWKRYERHGSLSQAPNNATSNAHVSLALARSNGLTSTTSAHQRAL
jgi:hypothetical protein